MKWPLTDVRIFDGTWRDNRRNTRRIFKLHGSLNWHLFDFGRWRQYATVSKDPFECRDNRRRRLNPVSITPMFLTGTTVKEQAYGVSLTGEIFARFRSQLAKHRTLICCGYGWGDKGINIRLNQWLHDAPNKRLVILYGNPVTELQRLPFWRFRWNSFIITGRLVVIPKWLSACSVQDLKPFFDK